MKCYLCPRKCGIDRNINKGICGATNTLKIAKYCVFKYEEPCISGNSGAIFFSNCSLKCVFCQNYDISSLQCGKEISINDFINIIKELESKGADNINLVNPTHYADLIIQALQIYKPSIPIIYNTHGFENEDTLKLLSKFVDVFLPDFKYYTNESALKYSNCSNYVEVTKNALKCMRNLKQDVFDNGMIKQGVIVRHLIMPLLSDESVNILKWIKENLPNTKVSLMAQYTPYGRAKNYPEINRKITKREYDKVVNKFLELELDGYIQDRESASEVYIPKWDF